MDLPTDLPAESAQPERDDLLELCTHSWERFRTRMAGLTEPEWRWQPTADGRLTLRWRVAHLTALLDEERNGPWLGLPAEPAAPAGGRPVEDALGPAEALAAADAAFARWRGRLAATTDASLATPIGPAAGRYGAARRRSFALHVVDELIHHTAEAALLRDLYAGGVPPAARPPSR